MSAIGWTPNRGGRGRAVALEDVPLAPVQKVPDQEIIAVEHPMIIQNLDRGLKTFGTNRPFRRILDSDDPEECLPLYLQPGNPMCKPILSVNAATTNVVVQITVPKRTGRKRKRSSQDPFTYADGSVQRQETEQDIPSDRLPEQTRTDDPITLRRMMQDNVDKYTYEVVAKVRHTHRFRGVSDFQQSTSNGAFMTKMNSTFLQGRFPAMKKFEIDPQMGVDLGSEIMPPPVFTGHSMPFNWGWEQNPLIYKQTDAATGKKSLVNASENKIHTANYLHRDIVNIPTRGPPGAPTEPSVLGLVSALEEVFTERPLWTRRGLMNRLGHLPSFYLLRNALPFVGYMFKGGPYRDAIIKYGIDPRKDPKYRIYQTMFYKMFSADDDKQVGDPWEDLRTTNRIVRPGEFKNANTHHFDGKNLTLDGKVWQICDVSDPLLKKLIDEAPVRETCDTAVDGWYTSGRLAKIKAIMRTKLIALRTGKVVKDEDFEDALALDDVIPGKNHRNIHVLVPDLRLTEEEIQELEDKGVDLTSLGITFLRKTDQSRNIHAKKARGSKAVIKRGRRGKYMRKETKNLITGGVDNAIAIIDKQKNRNQNTSGKKNGKGVDKTTPGANGEVIDSIEGNGRGYGDEAEEEDFQENDDEEEEDDDEEANGEQDHGDSEGTDDADFESTPKQPPGGGFAKIMPRPPAPEMSQE